MSDLARDQLCNKIARLVEEKGWNLEDFARNSDLNRLTVRSILHGGTRKLHNATVGACAKALGLSVSDLRSLPLDQLLPRVRSGRSNLEKWKQLAEQAMQPEVGIWMDNNSDRAGNLTPAEMDELLSLHGTGGPLTASGVAKAVELIERKRRIMQKVATVAGTEYFELLEMFVNVLYDRVQVYRQRPIH